MIMNTTMSVSSGVGLGDGALQGAPAPLGPQALDPAERDPELWSVAKEFEAAFLAEMLSHAKLGEMDTPFSGGPGEEQFRSLLVREYAATLSASDAFGLAETLYRQLQQKVSADVE